MSNLSNQKRGLPGKVRMRHRSHFVEELAARSEEPVGRLVPLASIEPDPEQPRSTMGDLTQLAESIRAKGVLEPILVRRVDEEPGKPSLRIISGERRYRAAMEAGLVEIPVIEMDVEEEEALEIALIENLQRKDLTPFEEAEGYRVLADRHGYTHEQISKSVGKSRTVVTESFALLQMSNRVRATAQALDIQTKSTLLEVLKAEDEAEMIRLLEEISRHGLSRDDMRRKQRSTTSASGAPRRKPYTFNFNAPDKSFRLSLKFRQNTVSKDDLIKTLEEILRELRAAEG